MSKNNTSEISTYEKSYTTATQSNSVWNYVEHDGSKNSHIWTLLEDPDNYCKHGSHIADQRTNHKPPLNTV